MLSTINFNNEFLLVTDKIDNIIFDRLLPPKFNTVYLTGANLKPKPLFGLCLFLS